MLSCGTSSQPRHEGQHSLGGGARARVRGILKRRREGSRRRRCRQLARGIPLLSVTAGPAARRAACGRAPAARRAQGQDGLGRPHRRARAIRLPCMPECPAPPPRAAPAGSPRSALRGPRAPASGAHAPGRAGRGYLSCWPCPNRRLPATVVREHPPWLRAAPGQVVPRPLLGRRRQPPRPPAPAQTRSQACPQRARAAAARARRHTPTARARVGARASALAASLPPVPARAAPAAASARVAPRLRPAPVALRARAAALGVMETRLMVKTHADYTKLARLHARTQSCCSPPPQPPQQQAGCLRPRPSSSADALARCARTRARAQHVAGGGGGRRRQ